MIRPFKFLLVVAVLIFTVSCSTGQKPSVPDQGAQPQQSQSGRQNDSQQSPNAEIVEKENSSNLNYNEMGKVMVLMYHRFVDKETDEWTRSFENFKKDLEVLYNKGYRPVNLSDYVDGNIDIPAGFTPVIFTFDDGTSGQFNLVEKDGKLEANPKSAVGIMEEFSRTHPDFPLKGTFFINHTGFFHGKGTPQERLQYLADRGFEIGNHTVNHINFSKKTVTPQVIQEEIGGHVKKTQALIPGYVVDQLALPLGITSKTYPQYIEKGEFEGVKYQNRVILLVGSNPAPSPIDSKLNILKLPRVRAMGNKPVHSDMYYWLDYFDKNPDERYISDGIKETFSVPYKYKERIDNKINRGITLLK